LAKKKPTPAEIELQLSERRFILEVMNGGAALLQVPIVTAFVWFYLSRTNASLGALNKAILAAELTPIIGDIKFPEGVLLGAAMESIEDFLVILEKAGIVDIDSLKKAAAEGVEDSGDLAANAITSLIGEVAPVGCDTLADAAFFNRKRSQSPDFWSKTLGTINFGLNLKSLKKNGCPKPDYVSEEIWLTV